MITRVLIWFSILLGHDTTASQRELAESIAAMPALFVGPQGAERTAALLTAIAWRESGLQLSAVGDSGRSVCAFQILGGNRALLTDAAECTRVAYTILQRSIALCAAHPVAVYARGTCDSVDGRKISADRVRVANRIMEVK